MTSSRPTYLLGIDVGTQGSKGVIVARDGTLLASEFIEHGLATPRPGWAEHDADAIWWGDFVTLTRRLLLQSQIDPRDIAAVGCCALSPDMLPVDASGRPLRSGILYGIDTRARAEILTMREDLGLVGRDALTAQHVGPKIVWFRNNEPERWRRTYKIVTAHGYIVARLTGCYVIDSSTAGGFRPFFDAASRNWDGATCAKYEVPLACLPDVVETTDVVGAVTLQAANETGLAEGTPVIAGSTDFDAEAVSTGVASESDLIVSYGTTMVLLAFSRRPVSWPGLFGGQAMFGGLRKLYDGLFTIGGGMATSAALTRWFRDNFGQTERRTEQELGVSAYQILGLEAEAVPPGSDGLIVLPYFSGERTPINDEQAQGVLFGLTLAHTRGHIYRALLEGISYGLLHHLDLMRQAGVHPDRIVATGGGSRNRLWAQIVSDVTGLPQSIQSLSSAALGIAFLAGLGVGIFDDLSQIRAWVRSDVELKPCAGRYDLYQAYYRIYRQLYEHTKEDMHAIAALRVGLAPAPVPAQDELAMQLA
jgi:xylulokinase